MGVLGDKATESKTRIIPIEDGHAILNDIKIPIDPMIDVIGVAPRAEDGEWVTANPWKHGGKIIKINIRIQKKMQGTRLHCIFSIKTCRNVLYGNLSFLHHVVSFLSLGNLWLT